MKHGTKASFEVGHSRHGSGSGVLCRDLRLGDKYCLRERCLIVQIQVGDFKPMIPFTAFVMMARVVSSRCRIPHVRARERVCDTDESHPIENLDKQRRKSK